MCSKVFDFVLRPLGLSRLSMKSIRQLADKVPSEKRSVDGNRITRAS